MTLGLILAALAGVSLGLLGGGGSILMVPILLYVFGLEAHQAVIISLFVVGVTSTTGFMKHAGAGNVAFSRGLIFAAGGMAGAFGGGQIGVYIPGEVLLIIFGTLMFVTAAAMLRSGKVPEACSQAKPIKLVVSGLAVGLLTGMVGAGGGFLVVPALVLLAGLPMKKAIGTSLMVIALQSFSGLLGYLSNLNMAWALALAVTAAAIGGSMVGVRLSRHISPLKLRVSFAYLVLVMACFILYKEGSALWHGEVTLAYLNCDVIKEFLWT